MRSYVLAQGPSFSISYSVSATSLQNENTKVHFYKDTVKVIRT